MAMTLEQAQEEAMRRWGEKGFAVVNPINGLCDVGVITSTPEAKRTSKILYGWGSTFEAAFELADIRYAG